MRAPMSARLLSRWNVWLTVGAQITGLPHLTKIPHAAVVTFLKHTTPGGKKKNLYDLIFKHGLTVLTVYVWGILVEHILEKYVLIHTSLVSLSNAERSTLSLIAHTAIAKHWIIGDNNVWAPCAHSCIYQDYIGILFVPALSGAVGILACNYA